LKIRLETEAKLSIQGRARDGLYSLCWSYVLDYENENNPYEIKRNAIAPWESVAEDYCPSSEAFILAARKL
jgi:hypothetical protein